MELVTVECMNFHPHDPHTWREGFLWLKKKKCQGYKKVVKQDWLGDYCKADVEATTQVFEWLFRVEPEHRHYYGFSAEKSDPVLMVWECMDPFCDDKYYRFRSLFNYQTRATRRILEDGYTVIYKTQKI